LPQILICGSSRLSTLTSTLILSCYKQSWNKCFKREEVKLINQRVKVNLSISLMIWTCRSLILITLNLLLLLSDNILTIHISMIDRRWKRKTSLTLNILLAWIQLLVHSSSILDFRDISGFVPFHSLSRNLCWQSTLLIWTSISRNSSQVFKKMST